MRTWTQVWTPAWTQKWTPIWKGSAVLLALALGAASMRGQAASPTYQIQSVTPATVPAGANGATLTLAGKLPDFSAGAYQVCFYTGAGSAAPLTPSAASIAVPASTIQAIPAGSFTATNGYAVQALVSIVAAGGVCDGTIDATLTNSFPVPIVEPTLGTYAGPTDIPQTNATTGLQAPPASILLTGNAFVGTTSVNFGTFGSVTPKLLTPSSLSVAIPAAFASSPAGTTADITVCNSGGSAIFCSTPATPITLTVAALNSSTGTITATPSPVTTLGQTTLTAQFAPGTGGGQPPQPGAPSGTVTFVADGTTLPTARLILDKTASFAAQVSTVTTPVTATPVITPAAGNYVNSVTVAIADATPGASIYYTQDGAAPTTSSTLYTGPFTITSTQTVQAIAAASGYLNSAAASAAYTVTISPPTQLAFLAQPVDTAINATITPALQVAIEDATGNVSSTATSPVTLGLASNPGDTSLQGTTTVNAVAGVATFSDLSLPRLGTGYTLRATSSGLTSAVSTAFNITPPPITVTVQSELVGIGSTLTGSFTLGQPAPATGLVVTLSSSDPTIATIAPATVTLTSGQTTGAFTYTGVGSGNATLSASATNYQTGTAQVTGTAAQVSLGAIPPVAPGQQTSLALSLATAAPPGGTTVTFVSSDPTIATVTSSVFVAAGQQTGTVNPQVIGVKIGQATITATAPGYAPATRTATVTVTAIFNPATSNINLATSTTTVLDISAPAQAGGLAFTLTSDDPTTATVPASVTVPQGGTSVVVPITGVKAGSTTIRADSPGVQEATGTVNVYGAINVGNLITGVSLENTLNLYLPVAPSSPTTVTVTIGNPAIATISSSAPVAGTTTLTFTNITSTYIGTIYVQGQSVGSATLMVSAPGYTTGTGTMTVDPSGFFIYGSNFSTTTFSTPTNFNVYTATLNPGTLTIYSYGYAVNPGVAPISVPVTSSNTAVGTITTSPVVFTPGIASVGTGFQPKGTGTATIALGTPAGFSTPTQDQQYTATVSAPAINVGNLTTGVSLENDMNLYLPVAPPSAETVTVTISNPAIATISSSGSVAGTTTLTFTNVTSTYIGTIYVQGQSVGSATLTISAPGYTTGTGTMTVDPSGFFIYGSNFSTTTFSAPTGFNVYTATLNPGTLTIVSYGYAINPGVAPISVPVTSSNTAVGTITTSPLVFTPGIASVGTSFQPKGTGTATIALGTPAGFSTPTQDQQYTATVSAPAISVGNLTTGVSLENNMNLYLPVAPPSAETVTVTISNPAIATISSSGSVAGTTTLTFTNVTSTYIGNIYVQGQSVGSATLTISAPGYTTGTSTMTVDPSGFFIYGSNFSTTTFSAPTGFNVYTATLNPGTLTIVSYGYAINPGVAPISVPVTSSNTTVGTITTSSLLFTPGIASVGTSFQPVSAGTSTISISTPAGFSTPTQDQQYIATVTAPVISIGNVVTGVNLENAINVYLPVAPPNPVTVTVTSNGPDIAVLSSSGTVAGGKTVTFANVTSTFVGAIYIQGLSAGTTTITESAPGYTNGVGNITVTLSGFAIGISSFTTTATSAPTGIALYPVLLNSGTLTISNYELPLAPQAGTVSVPVISSNTGVGTITLSPVVFNLGDSYQTTNFQPVATGTSIISIQTPAGFTTPSQNQQVTATVQ